MKSWDMMKEIERQSAFSSQIGCVSEPKMCGGVRVKVVLVFHKERFFAYSHIRGVCGGTYVQIVL
jgi:hypothetical protein